MVGRVNNPHHLPIPLFPTSTLVILPFLFCPHVGDIHPTEQSDLLTHHEVEECLPYVLVYHERTPLDCPNI